MVITKLRPIIVHQHIHGLVQSVYVEAVTLLHQELVMVVFDYGPLRLAEKTSGLYMTFHW